MRWFLKLEADRRQRTKRWALIGLGVLVLLLLPYPYETGGPFKFLPMGRTEIHSQVEGEIQQVLVKENDAVKAGQALAVVDKRSYERNLNATREQLTSTEARLRLMKLGPKPEKLEMADEEMARAQQEVEKAKEQVEVARVAVSFSRPRAERYAQLVKEDLVSRQDYENTQRQAEVDQQNLEVARQQLEVARKTLGVVTANRDLVRSDARPEEIESLEAEVRRLKVMVADYEEQLRLTVITSPVDGQVITQYVDQKVGQYLRKGELFAVVEQAGTLQAEVQVPEEDMTDIRLDARVKVVPWAYPGRTFLGRVVFIAPVASIEQRSPQFQVVRVLTEVPNPTGLLKSHLTGYAKIKTRWRPVWKSFFWPLIRWFLVQFWYWIP